MVPSQDLEVQVNDSVPLSKILYSQEERPESESESEKLTSKSEECHEPAEGEVMLVEGSTLSILNVLLVSVDSMLPATSSE